MLLRSCSAGGSSRPGSVGKLGKANMSADASYVRRGTERLVSAALVMTSIAAVSARHDYESREELGIRTQALMWPAYALGAVAIADGHRRSAKTGTAASRALGVTVTAAGVALFAAGAAPFQSFSQLAGRDPGGLITEGIYSRTRNPQYLGNVLLAVGSAAAARSAATAALGATIFASYSWYLPAEEAHLERIFGNRYRAYFAQVGRWWGRDRERHV